MPGRKEDGPEKKDSKKAEDEKKPKKDRKKEDELEDDENEESELDRKAKRLMGRIDAANRSLRGHRSRGGE